MYPQMNYSILKSIVGSKNAERIAFIDFKLRFTGVIKRIDLNSEYGLSDASASRLISQYSELRPDNLSYDRTKKFNVIQINSYEPLINISMDSALDMLAHGFNKNKLASNSILPYSKIGMISNGINLVDVARITRAIFNDTTIECTYMSNSSDKHHPRIIVPLAILSDGKNWYLRAYDRNEDKVDKFKMFSFSRITETKLLQGVSENKNSYEYLSEDNKWNLILPVSLELSPNLSPSDKRTVRKDFGMKSDQNELILMEKAALVWMLTKQWNIDTNFNKDKFYKFILKNHEMLKEYI